MMIALGEVYSGVFSVRTCPYKHRWQKLTQLNQTSNELWEQLHGAGEAEYDRFWRMPLDDDYLPQIQGSNADLQNVRSPDKTI